MTSQAPQALMGKGSHVHTEWSGRGSPKPPRQRWSTLTMLTKPDACVNVYPIAGVQLASRGMKSESLSKSVVLAVSAESSGRIWSRGQ